MQVDEATMAANPEADGPLTADRLLTVLGPVVGEERVLELITRDDGRTPRERLLAAPDLAEWRTRLDGLRSPRNYLGDTDRLITASIARHQRTRTLRPV
ncbi:MAG: hypothetical protein JWP66_1984 [Naasia sp.]|nr:hypothetical protein [Naasia sp.]